MHESIVMNCSNTIQPETNKFAPTYSINNKRMVTPATLLAIASLFVILFIDITLVEARGQYQDILESYQPQQQTYSKEWLRRRFRMINSSSDYPQESEQTELDESSLSDFIRNAYTRGNNIRSFTVDLQTYRPEVKFDGDPAFVNSQDSAHRARCQNDLDFYQRALSSVIGSDVAGGKISPDYLRLTDSFGRPEAGALRGNQFWLGSYEQCLEISLKPADLETIDSQYCLGLAHFPNWNASQTSIAIRIGLCLPVTCTSSMLNENAELLATVEGMMRMHLVGVGPYSELKLSQVYCLPHETSKLRQLSSSAIYFLLFVGAFVAMCCIATLLDHVQVNKKSEKSIQDRNWSTIMIESFSLTRNWSNFLEVRKDSLGPSKQSERKQPEEEKQPLNQLQPDESQSTSDWSYDRSLFLNTINGFKCIGLYLIIAGHLAGYSFLTSDNILDLDKFTQTILVAIYMVSQLMVDSFYAISGLITAFFLFKAGLNRIKWSQWLVLMVHRYWRLTPVYLICFWFNKSVGVLANSGPVWDFGTSEQSYRLNCARESWLVAVLHLSDFKSPRVHCVPMAYYIANEMKFYIIAPIFLLLIHKSMGRGYLVSVGAILTNIVYVSLRTIEANVDARAIVDLKPETLNIVLTDMEEVYVRPYSRIGAYLVGILCGHLLYLADVKKFQMKLSKRTTALVWILSLILLAVTGLIFDFLAALKLDGGTLLVYLGISLAAMRPIWALITCWFLVALAHGQVRWLSGFLGSKFFGIMSKLCFCFYLVQFEILMQTFVSPSQETSLSYYDLLSRPISSTVITIIVSLLTLLIFEYPLMGLEALFLPERPSKNQTHQNYNSTSSKSGETENTEKDSAL